MDEAQQVAAVKLRRNRSPSAAPGRQRQVRWSVAGFRRPKSAPSARSVGDVPASHRQSICLSAGFLSLSPAKTSPGAQTAKKSVKKKWRHSYTCGDHRQDDDDDNDHVVLMSVRPSVTDSVLYSIREEDSSSLLASPRKERSAEQLS